MSDPRIAALAWCSRDDHGWCERHNRPFAHCEAEALDTTARLRRIEEAARAVVADWKWDADPAPGEEAKVALLVALGLREALEEKP